MTAIVWFEHDLRLADQPALIAALAGHTQVVPLFVWHGETDSEWPIPWQDGARWFWDTLVDADLANNT